MNKVVCRCGVGLHITYGLTVSPRLSALLCSKPAAEVGRCAPPIDSGIKSQLIVVLLEQELWLLILYLILVSQAAQLDQLQERTSQDGRIRSITPNLTECARPKELKVDLLR
jgi:hypothetical protein